MRIIYPTDASDLTMAPIAVIIPTGEIPIELVASKDVPDGLPYLFVEDAVLDALDRADRAAWVADFSSPDGHGGQE